MPKSDKNQPLLLKTWTVPTSASLGSDVRIKGIVQDIKSRLSTSVKKALSVDGNALELIMPTSDKLLFNATAALITKALSEAEARPVIPREIENILGIKTGERKRWLEDGRLPSAGTRTVKLRGRARKITFHVFDPKVVQDLADQGVVDQWREDDVASAADKRREAAYRAKLTRSLRKEAEKRAKSKTNDNGDKPVLSDWDVFARDGLLR